MNEKQADSEVGGQETLSIGQVQQSMTEAEIEAVHLVPATRLNGPVNLAEYDPDWPRHFEREAQRIRPALGDRVIILEHVGSTSVPGLAAKPRIDMLLVVADSADEASYIPPLEAAGYVLHIREPKWYEHRTLKGPDTNINLHVFSQGCPEVRRMLLFRNWLREHPDERELYQRAKRELALRTWKYTQDYADAKSDGVEGIEQALHPGGVLGQGAPVRAAPAAYFGGEIVEAAVIAVRARRIAQHGLPALPPDGGKADLLGAQLDAHLVEELLHHLGRRPEAILEFAGERLDLRLVAQVGDAPVEAQPQILVADVLRGDAHRQRQVHVHRHRDRLRQAR